MKFTSPSCIVLAALLAGVFFASQDAACQGIRCGAGKDLVVQALERVTAQSGTDALEDALQLLKHAVSECSELGDAWYYRGLVEQRLGHAALSSYAMDKARLLGSEALDQGLNPFVLSTPATRGFSTEGAPATASTNASSPGGAPPQKWALVIGIGRFTDSGIPRLNYTTADANAFSDLLRDPAVGQFPGGNVHLLTDEHATTRNIKEELNWIARHAQPNDLVVIYVATHGTPRGMDSAGGANYLVTYDTEISEGGAFDEDALYATSYPMVELANVVATRMKALRTVVLLDTCYSGGSIIGGNTQPGQKLADTAPSAAMLSHITQGTGRIVIAASQVNEESLESNQLRHGYFTYYLLQALKSSNGQAPLSQVYASVARDVSQNVAALGMRQHPVMSRSSTDADFSLNSVSTLRVVPHP